MRLSATAAFWLTVVLLPVNVSALSLGEIDLRSNLNQPFNAEIPLDLAASEELAGLEVILADADTFARYGLDRPQFLNDFDFSVAQNEAGLPIIRLTSLTAVAEPFVTLLLDVKWTSGRLLREYTVLLDPPLYEETIVQAPAIAAPVADAPAESPAQGEVSRPVEAPVAAAPLEDIASAAVEADSAGDATIDLTFEPAAEDAAELPMTTADPLPFSDLGVPEDSATVGAAAADVMPESLEVPLDASAESPAPSGGVAAGNFAVQRGDTLWEIADDARGASGLSINQMMLAMYRASPEAFLGNINRLKAGAILRIPGDEEIAVISRGEAAAEVREQNNAWQSVSAAPTSVAEPRLELVAPGTGLTDGLADSTAEPAESQAGADGASDGTAAAAEAAGLRVRLAELEAEFGESERLIEVRDAELSALQARIQELEAQVAGSTSALEAEALGTELPVAGATELEQEAGLSESEGDVELESALEAELLEQELDSDVEAAAEDTVAETATDAETATAEVAADEPVAAQQPAAQPSLVDRLLSNIWLWVGAIVALLAVWLLARRRKSSIDDQEPFGTGEWDGTADEEPAEEFADLPRLDDAIVVEEGVEPEIAPSPAKTADKPLEEAADADAEAPLEKTISTGAPMNLDQADPIAEAEFHMAYGLYDQAADLLTKALQTEPDNRAYRVKLLEVYFVWENKDSFLDEARLLHGSLDEEGQSDWNKILILGKQLCPDDALFAGAETSAPIGEAIDLELPEASETNETSLDFSLDSPTVEDGAMGGNDIAGEIDFDLGEADLSTDESMLDIALDMGEADDDQDLAVDFGDEHETDMSNSYLALDLSDLEGAEAADADSGDDQGSDTIESPTIDALGADAPTVESDMSATTMETPTIEADMSASTMETPTIESPALAGMDDAVTMESPTLESQGSMADTSEMPGIDLDDLSDLELPDNETLGEASDEESDDNAALMISDSEATPDFESGDDAELLPAGTEELGELPDDFTVDFSGDDTAEQPAMSADADLETVLADSAEPAEAADTVEMPQEATMTEVGTKLDLARAYIDMGDPDGARSILNEVLAEGSEAQCQEAQQLLGELGD